MRTLVVAATAAELAPLDASLGARRDIDVLVTGVGMVATAARCSRAMARTRYDFALNLGLCGSFDPSLTPGVVVHVVSDRLAELGAEDGDAFLPIESLQLPSDHVVENTRPPANVALAWLPKVTGITVNTAHGNDSSIAAVVARWRPQVESMEGAAFMYACRMAEAPYAQVRAVSNVVERRNRTAWRMSDAVDALATAARAILQLT
jgi:futalosine hydrolase